MSSVLPHQTYPALTGNKRREALTNTPQIIDSPDEGFELPVCAPCDGCCQVNDGNCGITGQPVSEAKWMFPDCGFNFPTDVASELDPKPTVAWVVTPEMLKGV